MSKHSSTYSEPDDTVPLIWRRSSFCGAADMGCVDVSLSAAGAAVRDSKDPSGSVLRFDDRELAVFLLGVHNGEFEIPQP